MLWLGKQKDLAKLLPLLTIHEESCPPPSFFFFFFVASAVVHAKLNLGHDRGMQMNFFFFFYKCLKVVV